jgi:signal transduction histidine kinase
MIHWIGNSASHDKSSWLVVVFLIAAVALPTGCVLWFMRQAAEGQAMAARESVIEAYRGQLRLIRDRVDSYWQSRASELQQEVGKGEPENFARLASRGRTVVLFRADGALSYPSPSQPSGDELLAEQDWTVAQNYERSRLWPAAAKAYANLAQSVASPAIAAKAAQAEVRCLVKAGDVEGALKIISEEFSAGRFVNVPKARVIATDEQLLALHLMKPGDSRNGATRNRLIGWVNDYRAPMPATHRLFLMDELRGIGVKVETFPTYSAETMAARVLEAGDIRAGSGVEPTPLSGVWKLTAKGSRAVELLNASTVTESMKHALTDGVETGVSIEAVPPGLKADSDTIAAGPALPGWQIGFRLLNNSVLDEASRHRTTLYLGIGYAVVALMCITGLLMGQAYRKQFRLARLKTDLVAAVSHELKTPLASMQLLVDSLLEDRQFDPGKTKEYLAIISSENLRLTRLIENFLTFSRIERNRQRFEFAPTEPIEIVQTALGALRERLEQPGVTLNVSVDHGLSPIHADTDALSIVLINLVDNALKYTKSDKCISLLAVQKNGQMLFSVEDNGIGIAPGEQKKIFRKFYQVDRRLSREAGGCGLGLSIVDYIVRAHGGMVNVSSKLGEGSVFTVSLPCTQFEKAAA